MISFSSSCDVPLNDKHNYKIISLIALVLFCDYLLLTFTIPIAPYFLADRYDSFFIGVLFASKSLSQLVSSIILDSAVDNFGLRTLFLFGTFMLLISSFLFAYGVSINNLKINAYLILLVARIIQGIASSIVMISGMKIIKNTHKDKYLSTAITMAMSGVAVGVLLGPPIGGLLGYYVDLWCPYIFVAMLLIWNCTAQLIVLSKYKNKDESLIYEAVENFDALLKTDSFESDEVGIQKSNPNKNKSVNFFTLLQDPFVMIVVVITIISNASITMIEPLLPLYLSEHHKINIVGQGFIFACSTLSFLVFTPVCSIVSDEFRLPQWVTISIGLVVAAVGLSLLSVWPSAPLLGSCIALLLLGTGVAFVFTPTPLLLAVLSERHNWDDLESLFTLRDRSLLVGAVLGPLLGPLLQDVSTGFPQTALVFAVCCCAAIPLSCALQLLDRRERDKDEDNMNYLTAGDDDDLDGFRSTTPARSLTL